MAQISAALHDAGVEAWDVTQHQDCPFLMSVQDAAGPGRLWLRPHFTPRFAQVLLPTELAVATIEAFAQGRTGEGHATEDEALALWDRLVAAAEAIP
jgi:hypothetical protein